MRKTCSESRADRVFDAFNIIIMIVLLFVFIWPLWFVVIASISDPVAVTTGQVFLLPKMITLEGYQKMLKYTSIWTGYFNTICYTVVGTVLNLIMSVMMAYPISDRTYALRKPMLAFYMVTMYFGGGLVPTFLLFKSLGIVNTFWAMIVPGLISVYNALIIRNYFMNSIPEALKEAATLDGANAAQYLVRIVLPLSKPVLAVVGMYYMVGHWNDFANALYYLYDSKYYPLQTVLRDLLISSRVTAELLVDAADVTKAMREAQVMQYGVIIAAALPMLCAYPFIQKYFVKGVMVGSMKG